MNKKLLNLHEEQSISENEEVVKKVAYWRKANQIHNWFIENVQDGCDDCDAYEVNQNQLLELLDVCKKVVTHSILLGNEIKDCSVAKKLLPTLSGFFFGDTDYNQWYLQNVQLTIDKLEKILDTTDFEKQIIFYTSSW